MADQKFVTGNGKFIYINSGSTKKFVVIRPFPITCALTNVEDDATNPTVIFARGRKTLVFYTLSDDYNLPASKEDITVEGAEIESWTVEPYSNLEAADGKLQSALDEYLEIGG